MGHETSIFCTFQVEGLHCWPRAPKDSYLKHLHRHMFHFRVEMRVRNPDRDIEFISMKNQLEQFVATQLLRMASGHPVASGLSCEAMAYSLLTQLKKMYGEDRAYTVEVSEDGENGGIMKWIP